MMVKDEWIRAAIADDNLVVELLVRLKQAQAAPPASKYALPAFKWGIRQRRSKPMLLRCEARRDGDFNVSASGSPTTPLCWSGGSSDASPSAAAGFEETSSHDESCKEHQATSQNLKRTRLDSNSSLIGNEPERVPCPRPRLSSDSTLPSDDDRELPLDSRNAGKLTFVLPDLNMVPAEDDSDPEMLHRSS
ncbi:homeobox protein knotted-1-like 3-like [Hibiscus syriacus]|uniref:Homeobox protein knotted-1-like 3-like n=1 Tax=Hibiscus syriacus TaxID=106335 RepID=A0A6A3BYH7_HIBSY|nr:homeobox protein knotted-1-like 3-like [Hibiscus syriacus]